jgi:3-keto-5-aminohexanoate cleavage enzyme
MDELIICVAPHPGDMEAERFEGKMEVPQEVLRSYNAGASIAHLHVRNESGTQVADSTFFQSNVEEIRRSCPIIIEGSTGGTPEHTLQERSASFRVPGVEMGSLNMGSINMYDGVYQNPISEIRYYARELRQRRIKPFLCVFDLSMLYNVKRLEEEGVISRPLVYNLVFDTPGCLPFTKKTLDLYLDLIPEGSHWFLTRHHSKGWEDFRLALEHGGNVRVGYEDSPFLYSGKRAQSNAELVEEVAREARLLGRKVIDPQRAREIMAISSK